MDMENTKTKTVQNFSCAICIKAENASKSNGVLVLPKEKIFNISKQIGDIGKKYNFKIETCAEDVPVEEIGLGKVHCGDGELIKKFEKRKRV